MMQQRDESAAGVAYGIAAYTWWGLVAAYFKLVAEVAPLEILAHRITWSVAVLLLLIAFMHRWRALADVIADRRALGFLIGSTIVIAGNWFVFIWAVTHSRMLEASLGYFINPLVSVAFGFFFLRERLRVAEWSAVALAGFAVIWLTTIGGAFPWISLILAVSFALYGLIRKFAAVPSIEALTVETLILLPIALGYLVFREREGVLAFAHSSLRLDLLLIAAGPITALPLLWFAAAVRRLRLATVGLLQYISPTIQLFMAVLLFHEPFGMQRGVAFGLIWVAVAIYTIDNFRKARERQSDLLS